MEIIKVYDDIILFCPTFLNIQYAMQLTCNTPNVVYLISCSNCYDKYVRSALGFKSRFRIHKTDIKNKRDRCDTARHFNTKCTDSFNPHKFLKTQIIESVQCDYSLEGKL